MDKFSEPRTNDTLLSALSQASLKAKSVTELYHQRVSFIFGQLDEKSNVTHTDIKKVLAGQGILDASSFYCS